MNIRSDNPNEGPLEAPDGVPNPLHQPVTPSVPHNVPPQPVRREKTPAHVKLRHMPKLFLGVASKFHGEMVR